jgi:hypothetical protein
MVSHSEFETTPLRTHFNFYTIPLYLGLKCSLTDKIQQSVNSLHKYVHPNYKMVTVSYNEAMEKMSYGWGEW